MDIFDAKAQQSMLQLFDPGAVEQIETILCVASPHDRVRFELGLALWKFLNPSGAGLASAASLHAYAKDIADAVRDLHQVIGAAEEDTISTALIALGDHSGERLFRLLDELAELSETLNKLFPKSAGGRPADNDRNILAIKLHGIYQAFTGHAAKKPYQVPSDVAKASQLDQKVPQSIYVSADGFMDVVDLTFRAAKKIRPHLSNSNNAIGSLVTKILTPPKMTHVSPL